MISIWLAGLRISSAVCSLDDIIPDRRVAGVIAADRVNLYTEAGHPFLVSRGRSVYSGVLHDPATATAEPD